MSDQTKFQLLIWVEWATKLIIVSVLALVWQNNNDMQALKAQIASQNSAQQSVNSDVKAELSAIKQGYMTRMEVLENMKRIELFMENQVQQSELNRLRGKKGAPL